MPPHDPTSERALLGVLVRAPEMLRAVPHLRREHLYDPRARDLFDAVRDANDTTGVVPDVHVVREKLDRAGTLTKVGGLPALFALIEGAPFVGNVGWHAQRVIGAAHRRQALALAQRVMQVASDAVDDDMFREQLADQARLLADVAGLSPAVSEGVPDGLVMVGAFLDEPELADDWVVPGLLARMDRVIVVAAEGRGKALALDTIVRTVDGPLPMRDVRVGHRVFDEYGQPCTVVATTDVMRGRPCFRLRFSDGTEVVADAEHEWVTLDYRARQPHTTGRYLERRTTAEIAATLHARRGHTVNHAIPVAAPLHYPAQTEPYLIAPYTLGAWLGDGTSTNAGFTSADEEIVDNIRADGYVVTGGGVSLHWLIQTPDSTAERVAEAAELVTAGVPKMHAAAHVGIGRDQLSGVPSGWVRFRRPTGDPRPRHRTFQELLRDAGVLGGKHIPDRYLRGTFTDRLALLQGLMDTDGTVEKAAGTGRGFGASRCEITLTNERLARDTFELVVGLGHKATIAESAATLNGREVSRRWRIVFQTSLPVCRLRRKRERLLPLRTERARRRYIVACDPVESVPVRCIQVDSPSRQYLITNACIPTHNSYLARQVAACVAAGRHPFRPVLSIPPQRTLIVDLENPPRMIRSGLRRVVDPLRGEGAWQDDRAWLYSRPGGLNLRRATDAALLERVIAEVRPALVCLGPLYKAFLEAGDRAEQAAGEVAAVLDRLREKYRCALWLEHHAPMEQQGHRPLRPFGSGLWARWAEFGVSLRLDVESDRRGRTLRVERFRGDRDAREWPAGLTWGPAGEQPWRALSEEELDEMRLLNEARR